MKVNLKIIGIIRKYHQNNLLLDFPIIMMTGKNNQKKNLFGRLSDELISNNGSIIYLKVDKKQNLSNFTVKLKLIIMN